MDQARTVLVVDDEPQILRLVERMLGSSGVKVIMAPRPSEALKIFELIPVDVLISDVALPEMDGIRLAERVLKLYPLVSVLLISGHYKEPPASIRSARVRFLKKPFFPSQLVDMLREML
ncbi:MAG TPA: response regulator [Candidatus Sulfopaludibacter sp.]|jgi:DNA-binding NtrC family response regulator|nr:response regulator [Candidatus Sulfopaludibacter sp.]